MHNANRWAFCDLGHKHWGSLGAAGLLLTRRTTQGPVVLLQHRASWVHYGDTWSIPGGAIHICETPLQAALREMVEETGLDVMPTSRVVAEHVDDHGGWSYTTIVASCALPIASVQRGEQQDLRWVDAADAQQLLLHPGFAATWPDVQALLVSA